MPPIIATINIPVSSNAPTFHTIGPSGVLPDVLMVGDQDDITIAGNSFIQVGGISLNLFPNIDFKSNVEVALLMRFSYGGVELLVVRGTGQTGSESDEPYTIIHTPESGSYSSLFDAISGTLTPVVLELEYTVPTPVEFQGQPFSIGLSLSQSSLFVQDAYINLSGQPLSLGLSLSQATLSAEDIVQVDFQGQPFSIGLSLSQAVLATSRLLNLPGRASPIRNDNSMLARSGMLFAPIPARKLTGAFPAFCPSKRVLLGSKVYPFAGLDYIGNFELTAASWKWKRDNDPFSAEQAVLLGNFTDILAAIRFAAQTLDAYGTYLYEITLIGEINEATTISINILCNVIAGLDKSVQRNITFKPFADFMIAKNAQALQNIQYEISGDSVLARKDVERSTIFLGQHEAIRNSDHVFDGKRDFHRVDINLGSDILYNVEDMCSGIIMSIGDNGNSLIPDALVGGTLNTFNPGDFYLVQDGDDLDKRARKLELSISELSTSLVKLRATDLSGNVSVGNVSIRCD